MQRAVSALNEEFPSRVRTANVDATADSLKAEIKALGFKNHGLAIRDPEGKVLFKQNDHTVKIEDVRGAIRSHLGTP